MSEEKRNRPWPVKALPERFVSYNAARDFPVPWEVTEGEQASGVYRFRLRSWEIKYRPTRATIRGEVLMPEGGQIQARAVLIGVQDELKAMLKVGAEINVFATVSYLNDIPWLKVIEVVSDDQVGTIEPRYPARHKIAPEEKIDSDRSYAAAADWLIERYARDKSAMKGGEGYQELHQSLCSKLMAVHEPKDLAAAAGALAALKKSLCIRVAEEMAEGHQKVLNIPPEIVLTAHQVREPLLPRLPGIELNQSQMKAVGEILADLARKRRMWRLLMGDVGTGKTLVFLTVAATLARYGHRVLIMEPTRPLASQVEAVLLAAFVESGVLSQEEAGNIRIGTTGLLFEESEQPPALTIIDEQQKYSVGQKLRAAEPGAHVLEVSATFIPRTHELAELGLYPVSLLEAPPVERTITTRAVSHQESRRVMDWVERYLEANPEKSILVVYPERTDKEAEAVKDVESAGERWARRYPTDVVHGALDEGAVSEAIARVIRGKTKVLVTTVLLETGLDLPNLGAVIIGHAERFGLATLHQIRGRVARRGGQGYCYLVAGPKIKDQAWERLSTFAGTRDGNEVAAIDLQNRGSGDIGVFSDLQSGNFVPLPGLGFEQWALTNRASVRKMFTG